jgi:hypothetical protein
MSERRRKVFLLRLRAERDDDDVVIRNLRQALKLLLRRYRLHCLECREEQP